MGQSVLVFEAGIFRNIGEFQGYAIETERYVRALLDPANNRFIDRGVAEEDPRYKQFIPYVVLRYRDSVFSYVRGKKSSEARLVAMRSIGVGGHIEPADQSLFSSDREMYLEAARREVNEEVKIDTSYVEHIVALINDDSTDVGKVHLGIMHIWDLAEPKVTKREGLITRAGFVPITRLKTKLDELETWSQIALQALEDHRVPSWEKNIASLLRVAPGCPTQSVE
jgi:predicted NUDIX family phosphoesterase